SLPVGGFLIMMGHAQLKSYSALAHGSRYLHYWRYGPAYANYLPYSWSHSKRTVQEVATVCSDLARIENLLLESEREPARVALLYAKTDPIYGRSQAENRLVYFALLHDQIAVDLVTELQIEEDGLLSNYDFLYVTDESVRRKSQKKIAEWVKAGGKLWLSGGAATRGEFDEPINLIHGQFGAESSQQGAPQELRLAKGEQAASAEPSWRIETKGKSNATVFFKSATTAQTDTEAGSGRLCLSAFRPGVLYEATVRPNHNRTKGKGVIQKGWSNERRHWITGFALAHDVERTVIVDRPCIEVVRYLHPTKDLVMLINYTGEESDLPLNIQIRSEEEITQVESLRHGVLRFEKLKRGAAVNVPIALTDTLIVSHE
ncbi:MAG: hypothetical protein QF473_22750, partial [Planctomycetota bacterium]|nr:hypothetical protein [Planctomycetota bacterium]